MKKEELAKQYADKKVDEQQVNYPVEFRPEDIKQAYEDGFNEAMELACDFIGNIRRIDDSVIEDFKKYVEINKCNTQL